MTTQKTTFICHAVVKNQLVTDDIPAVSEKQAWFFFAQKYGYKMRDFKVVGKY